MNVEPRYQIDADVRPLWDAIAGAHSPGYADSYLYGAVLRNRQLVPRTVTGYLALDAGCSKIFERLGVVLIRPVPFQESGRASVVDEMPNLFGGKKR